MNDQENLIDEMLEYAKSNARIECILSYSGSPSACSVSEAIARGVQFYFSWRSLGDNEMERALQFVEGRYHPPKISPKYIDRARTMIDRLTIREQQVLFGMVGGRKNKCIAECLGISRRTVEVHRANILRKLESENSITAVKLAIESDYFELNPEPGHIFFASFKEALS